MKLLLLLLCSFVLSATSSFDIKGMVCGAGCVDKIKTHIGSLDGVKSCDVNFNKGTMIVDYDELKLNDATIIKTLSNKTTYSCSIKKDKEPKKGFFQRIFSWF